MEKYDNYEKQLEDTGLNKLTIVGYKNTLKRLFISGVDPLDDEDNIISVVSQTKLNKLPLLNVCIVLRNINGYDSDSLRIYRHNLTKSGEFVKKINPSSLPSKEDLINHMLSSTGRGYIVNYLLVNFSCRNLDLCCYIDVCDDCIDDKGNNNFLILRKDRIIYKRNCYKTVYFYGKKEFEIYDPLFIKYCWELEGQWLVNKCSNTSFYIRKYTLQNLCQGTYNKILLSNSKMSDLKKISENRGTSKITLLKHYLITE